MIVSLFWILLTVFGGVVLVLLPGVPPSVVNKEAAQWVATIALFLGAYWSGVRVGMTNQTLDRKQED